MEERGEGGRVGGGRLEVCPSLSILVVCVFLSLSVCLCGGSVCLSFCEFCARFFFPFVCFSLSLFFSFSLSFVFFSFLSLFHASASFSLFFPLPFFSHFFSLTFVSLFLSFLSPSCVSLFTFLHLISFNLSLFLSFL